MTDSLIIVLDAMGGDFGPEIVIPAAAMAHEELGGQVRFQFYGRESDIRKYLNNHSALISASEVIHTAKVISSHDKPSVALRAGRDSSMRLAIDAVKEGRAHAVVSAGNTGALMATAKIVLKCLPGITRPAIASVFPTKTSDIIIALYFQQGTGTGRHLVFLASHPISVTPLYRQITPCRCLRSQHQPSTERSTLRRPHLCNCNRCRENGA